jgi:hypothetical protein
MNKAAYTIAAFPKMISELSTYPILPLLTIAASLLAMFARITRFHTNIETFYVFIAPTLPGLHLFTAAIICVTVTT